MTDFYVYNSQNSDYISKTNMIQIIGATTVRMRNLVVEGVAMKSPLLFQAKTALQVEIQDIYLSSISKDLIVLN